MRSSDEASHRNPSRLSKSRSSVCQEYIRLLKNPKLLSCRLTLKVRLGDRLNQHKRSCQWLQGSWKERHLSVKEQAVNWMTLRSTWPNFYLTRRKVRSRCRACRVTRQSTKGNRHSLAGLSRSLQRPSLKTYGNIRTADNPKCNDEYRV